MKIYVYPNPKWKWSLLDFVFGLGDKYWAVDELYPELDFPPRIGVGKVPNILGVGRTPEKAYRAALRTVNHQRTGRREVYEVPNA